MRCKECYFVTPDYEPDCEHGPCPLEITEAERQSMMQQILLQMPKWKQNKILNGYRKVIKLVDLFDGCDDDLLMFTCFFEDAMPAYQKNKITDSQGYVTDRYYELLNAAKSNMDKETYYETVMERKYSNEKDNK